MKELDVEFTKIVGEGKAIGRKNGKIVFSYGVLPGETAKIRVIKEKKNYIEGEVIEILSPSIYRNKPEEEHYLSCSPWQIMDYEFQLKTKKNLTEELLYQMTKENIKLENFYAAEKLYHYRTKIEYSFTQEEEKLIFAFHKRGDYSNKIPLPEGCDLIDENINNIALKALEKLNYLGVKKEQLKTLVIRKAENTKDIILCLYSKDENLNISLTDIEGIKGFILIYSNPISSISSIDKIIKIEGKEFISEKICGMEIDYGFDCFFQNNIPLFEKALNEIKNSAGTGNNFLDLYCGTGVIGIYLKDKFKNLLMVEAYEPSLKYAKINAEKNNINNYRIIYSASEKIESQNFNNIDLLIVDPPRAGLHKNVIKNIMENLPSKIAYLSCNPITQGRDAVYLMEKYKIVKAIGFDFYPNTPHIENLLIFEKK